jgi:hypothetical protein
MSTIHRPAPVHLWWYVAGVALAAAVAVLAFTVLSNAISTTGTDTGPAAPPPAPVAEKWHAGPACFAAHPGRNADLAGECVTHAR